MKVVEEFRTSQNQKRLADLLDDPIMKRAIEISLIEFSMRIPDPVRIEQAAIEAARLDGAKKVLEILTSLGKPFEKRVPLPPVHLSNE
jgi:hypothetical protein